MASNFSNSTSGDDDGLQITVDSLFLAQKDFQSMFLMDVLAISISIIVIITCISINMEQCIMGCFGISLVVFSLPITALLANGVFQIMYFGEE